MVLVCYFNYLASLLAKDFLWSIRGVPIFPKDCCVIFSIFGNLNQYHVLYWVHLTSFNQTHTRYLPSTSTATRIMTQRQPLRGLPLNWTHSNCLNRMQGKHNNKIQEGQRELQTTARMATTRTVVGPDRVTPVTDCVHKYYYSYIHRHECIVKQV